MQIYKFLFRQKDGESMKPRKKCGTETLWEPAQRHVAEPDLDENQNLLGSFK